MFNVFNIGSYLEAASSYAAEIDQFILLIAALVGGPFIIAEILLIGFAIKFRKKEGVKAKYITCEDKKTNAGSLTPTISYLSSTSRSLCLRYRSGSR